MGVTNDLEVIDITDLSFEDEARVAKLTADITRAVTTSGFFYLKIEQDFGKKCTDMLEAGRQFYALPRKEIEKTEQDSESQIRIRGVPIPGTGAGLRPQGKDHAFLEDFRDTYHISVPIVDETKIDYFSESYSGNGKTKWPNLDRLPANWKPVWIDYAARCLKAAKILQKLLALSLGLDKDFFDQDGYFDKPTCLLGVNRYKFPTKLKTGEPISPEIYQRWIDGDPLGIRPHLDSGIFTFLLTNGVQGLERCVNNQAATLGINFEERQWAPVFCPPPEDGTLIVNLGKNMDYWTGGKFRATLHRVVDKTYGRHERYSVPFFYETNIDTVIEPLVEDCQEVRDYIAKNFEGKQSICAADLLWDRLKKCNDKKNII